MPLRADGSSSLTGSLPSVCWGRCRPRLVRDTGWRRSSYAAVYDVGRPKPRGDWRASAAPCASPAMLTQYRPLGAARRLTCSAVSLILMICYWRMPRVSAILVCLSLAQRYIVLATIRLFAKRRRFMRRYGDDAIDARVISVRLLAAYARRRFGTFSSSRVDAARDGVDVMIDVTTMLISSRYAMGRSRVKYYA